MKGKLLVLTPRFPFPLYGGDVLRIYKLCEALKRNWDITLVSICQDRAELRQPLPTDNPFAVVHRVFLPRWRSYFQAALAVLTGRSLQIAYYRSRNFHKLVRALALRQDAMLCHLIRMAPYARDFAGQKYLELTDYTPLTYRRANSLGRSWGSLRRLAYLLEERRVERSQNAMVGSFDCVSVISELDKTFFVRSSNIAPERVLVFANGVDVNFRKETSSEEASARLVFIGNMTSMPNADAVQFFVKEVLPIILGVHPAVRVRLIGRMTRRLTREMSGQKAVEVIGTVEKLAVATEGCHVGICPVRAGAGVQNKVLEYMALGLATVTTSVGAEGLDVRRDEHVLIADDAREYADCVIRLIEDRALRSRLRDSARNLVETTYTWATQLRPAVERIRLANMGLSSERDLRAVRFSDDERVTR